MKTPVFLYQNVVDATIDECIGVIDIFLNDLATSYPDISLIVELAAKNLKKVWIGRLVWGQSWGIPDEDFGYVEIIPIYDHLQKPVQVRIFCFRPEDNMIWKRLEIFFKQNLPSSDGFPSINDEPWTLIEDVGDDRKILKYWLAGKTAYEIGSLTGYAPRTIYDRLRILRKKYGGGLIPKKKKKKANP